MTTDFQIQSHYGLGTTERVLFYSSGSEGETRFWVGKEPPLVSLSLLTLRCLCQQRGNLIRAENFMQKIKGTVSLYLRNTITHTHTHTHTQHCPWCCDTEQAIQALIHVSLSHNDRTYTFVFNIQYGEPLWWVLEVAHKHK